MSFDKFPLGELCEILDTRRKPITKSNRIKGEYPYYGATGIVDYVRDYIFDEKLVLIGEDGAKWDSGEKTAFIADGKYWVNNHAHVVKPKRKIILDEWMVYFFFYKDLNEFVTGVTVPKLNQEKLKSIPIPLPPLPIQQKIVAKLDKIFAEIDKAIASIESKTKNLENFFNSYFLFLKSENRSNWKKKTIGQLCNLMTGGTPSTKEKKYYQNGNIPWLVSGDINLDIINDCKGRITELGLKNSNAKFLPINSVMIALNGQGKTRGSVAILNTKATCNQSLVSIIPKDPNEIKSEIIYYILKSRYNEIRKLTGDSGNDRRGLNMPIIRKIELFYPLNLSEQNEIIKSSNLILLKLKKINEINLIKINELNFLKQSILKKAFNGELVKAA
jgi:type I restriction enzyme S subunit